jgi:hypothetical protein
VGCRLLYKNLQLKCQNANAKEEEEEFASILFNYEQLDADESKTCSLSIHIILRILHGAKYEW